MPYNMSNNNAYLIETSDGWAAIDVGVDLPANREMWRMALKEVGIPFSYISKIYATHCHPDHLGAAGWLQSRSGAPVFLLEQEIQRAKRFIFMGPDFEADYFMAIKEETDRHGFPEHIRKDLITDWHRQVAPLYPQPAEILPLKEGQTVDLAGDDFQVIQAPGHADGQFILWSPRRRHLFSADVLADSYLHFSDWPNTLLENPLGSFLKVIDRLQTLGDIVVFPGHGPSFTDLGVRLTKLRRLHERRMEKILAGVKKPATAGEIYSPRTDLPDQVHLHRLVLGETLGYLTYLADQGYLARDYERGQVLFGPLV